MAVELPLTLTTSPLIPTYNLSGTVPSERLTITVEGRSIDGPARRTPHVIPGEPCYNNNGVQLLA